MSKKEQEVIEKKEPVEKQQPAASVEPPAEQAAARSTVRKGGLVVLALILLSLAWYLLADRYTPSTSQARVQGYIVGVAPKVGGLLTDVWVENNQEVKKGQRLFQIDPSAYRIALDKAQSDLDKARSQVDAGNAAVEAARANLRAAEANAERAEKDYDRQQRLWEDDPGTISMRRLEMSYASLKQSRAAVDAARANVRLTIEQKGGIDDQNNAFLNAASSAVEKAELDLADTTVTASADGLITDLRADVGQFAGTGSPVLTLISIHDLWINAEFTENNLGHLKEGSPVEILFDAMPGRVFKGSVRSIGFGVSAGNPPPPGALPSISNNRDWLRQAQRFPVVIGFDPRTDEELLQQLRIGGQATVIAYPKKRPVLNFLGKLYIRVLSFFSYAY
ncbi:MAG: HlyD family secretion protein [Puniceicoccaceae bacterium]